MRECVILSAGEYVNMMPPNWNPINQSPFKRSKQRAIICWERYFVQPGMTSSASPPRPVNHAAWSNFFHPSANSSVKKYLRYIGSTKSKLICSADSVDLVQNKILLSTLSIRHCMINMFLQKHSCTTSRALLPQCQKGWNVSSYIRPGQNKIFQDTLSFSCWHCQSDSMINMFLQKQSTSRALLLHCQKGWNLSSYIK